jgi:hypothetical protein
MLRFEDKAYTKQKEKETWFQYIQSRGGKKAFIQILYNDLSKYSIKRIFPSFPYFFKNYG